MTVFTAYFCGTGSTRYDAFNPNYWNGELISTLANNDQGREFANWVAVDGPGSGNLQQDQLFVRPGYHAQLMGTLLGSGWEENVAHVLQMIKGRSDWARIKLDKHEYQHLKKSQVPIPEANSTFIVHRDYGTRKVTPQALQQQIIKQFRPSRLPIRVNLVGWSRGGISCHMLANAMAADPELKDIPVNIFAVDPVPGLFNLQKERLMLRDNVKEYVGFYARDERSRGFASVLPLTASSTHRYLYSMPGRHATLVGNGSLDGKSGGMALIEPGLIVRHTAEVFLRRWGVKLDRALNLSHSQLMGYQRLMVADDREYRAMRGESYTLLTEGTKAERLVYVGPHKARFGNVLDEGLALGRRSSRNA